MKAIKAVYQNGKVKLSEKPTEPGPTEVVVVFPEPNEDPWEAILSDRRPRPALARRVQDVRDEIAKGKAKPLDRDKL